MGRFESCESIVAREYDHFEEVNALNIAAITRFSSLVLLSLLFTLNKNGFRRFGIRLSILPSYFDYIISLIVTYFIFGIFAGFGGKLRKLPIVIALETGVGRMFAEGLAIFLMQYGAGYYGLRKATLYSSIWGLLVVAIGVTIDEVERFHSHEQGGDSHVALLGRLIFYCLITLFYFIVLMSPLDWIYRRPAFRPFAWFQVFTGCGYILVAVFFLLEYELGYCFLFAVTTILDGIVFPLIVFLSLSLDSEFWQGIGNSIISNPLAGVWDLEMDTITAMGQKLADIESSSGSGKTRKLPIIHFGFIELDEHLGYVAGGLSRVYFGKIKKTPVAVKILFAMELTPQVVTAFYDEIQILYALQHPNVVTCLGVSVMPPAVCVVLEYCKHGSLFDYLYKPITPPHVGLDEEGGGGGGGGIYKRSFDQSVTELSNIVRRASGTVTTGTGTGSRTRESSVDHDLSVASAATGGGGTGGGAASKRSSRPNTAEDSSSSAAAASAKRKSQTLDEVLAKKRGSRSKEEMAMMGKAPATLPKLTPNSSSSSYHPSGDPTHSPLQRVDTTSASGGLATDRFSLGESGGIRGTEAGDGKGEGGRSATGLGFLERASSVVDSLFGRTPQEHPSVLDVDPERYSTSQNDRLRFLVSSGSSRANGNQESLDINGNNRQSNTSAGSFSSPHTHRSSHSHSSNARHGHSSGHKSMFSVSKGGGTGRGEMRQLSWEEKFEMIVGVCRGLAFLHEKGYMHCDLKSPNFLVSNDKTIKLADLGEAREIDQSKQLLSLPNPALNWRPPEMMNPNVSLRFYTTASDVYSLSMVISEILNQEVPLDDVFRDLTFDECYSRLVSLNSRPPLCLPEHIPQAVCQEFSLSLQRAWHTDPNRRPSCRELTAAAERVLHLLHQTSSIVPHLTTTATATATGAAAGGGGGKGEMQSGLPWLSPHQDSASTSGRGVGTGTGSFSQHSMTEL